MSLVGRVRVGVLFVLQFVCGTMAYSQSDELPSAAEIVSGFQANAAANSQCRIRYSYVHTRFEGYRDLLQLSIDTFDRALRAGKVPDSKKELWSTGVDAQRAESKSFRPGLVARYAAEIWRDGSALQVRQPTNGEDFPNVILSAENLPRYFRGISIFSRPNFEARWMSLAMSDQKTAVVMLDDLPAVHMMGLPPMMAEGVVRAIRMHPLDQVFVGGADGLVVAGRERLGEFDTIVVERATVFPWWDEVSAEQKARVVLKQVVKSWLDIDHGYIPRQIAHEGHWFCDGKRVETARYTNGVPIAVTDVTIEKIPNAGFYPTHGKVLTWTNNQDPDGPTPLEIFDGLKPALEVTKALVDEVEWNAEVTVPDEMTEFDLTKVVPADALVMDVAAQQIMVRDSQGDLIRANAEQLGIVYKSSGYSTTVLAVCGLVAVCCVAAAWRSLRKRNSTK